MRSMIAHAASRCPAKHALIRITERFIAAMEYISLLQFHCMMVWCMGAVPACWEREWRRFSAPLAGRFSSASTTWTASKKTCSHSPTPTALDQSSRSRELESKLLPDDLALRGAHEVDELPGKSGIVGAEIG